MSMLAYSTRIMRFQPWCGALRRMRQSATRTRTSHLKISRPCVRPVFWHFQYQGVRRPRSRLADTEHVVNQIAQGEPSTALILAQQYLFLKHILLARHAPWLCGKRSSARQSATAGSAIYCGSSRISARQRAADFRRPSPAASMAAGACPATRFIRPAFRLCAGSRSGHERTMLCACRKLHRSA